MKIIISDKTPSKHIPLTVKDLKPGDIFQYTADETFTRQWVNDVYMMIDPALQENGQVIDMKTGAKAWFYSNRIVRRFNSVTLTLDNAEEFCKKPAKLTSSSKSV